MKKLFIGLILIVSCLEIPIKGLGFDMGRVWGLRLGIILLWLMTVIYFWKKGINTKKLRQAKGLIFLMVLWSIFGWISLIFGSDPWKSLWGNLLRGDGYLTFLAFGLLAVWLSLFWEKKWESTFSWLVVTSGVVQVMAQVINCQSLTKLNCGGWMGNSVLLAGFLVMVVPFWGRLLNKAKKKERLLLLMVGILLMWGLLLTGTWISILGLFLLAIHYLGINIKVTFITTMIFLMIGGLVWWRYESNLGFVAESRQRIWMKGMLGSLKRPIFGWGMANFDYAFEATDWPIHLNNDVVADKAHNELLEQLVSGGFVGLLFYLTAWGMIFKKILEKKDEKAFYLLMILVYWVVTSVNVVPIEVQLIFWWLFGMGITYSDHQSTVGGRA